MKKVFKILGGVFLFLVALLVWPAWAYYTEIQKSISDDPVVWEENIAAMEAAETDSQGAILFTGSSSIRLWSSLAEDMVPYKTVNRGFGGAKMADLIHYAPRLVDLTGLVGIVIFVGTNDVTPQKSRDPGALAEAYRALVDIIRARHPELPIFYIGITPSVLRWAVWDKASETNALIQAYADSDPGLYFIDTSPGLLRDGIPDENLYIYDGLHLNAEGYKAWTSIIKPAVSAVLPAD